MIVFTSNGVLNRVPAAGGDCVRGLKDQPAGSLLTRPSFFPDGRHFIASDAPRLETVIADLETGGYERLRQGCRQRELRGAPLALVSRPLGRARVCAAP